MGRIEEIESEINELRNKIDILREDRWKIMIEKRNFIGKYIKLRDFHDADVICSNVSKSGGAMVLKNTNKGYSWSFAGQFATEPVKNLKIEASYIHTEAYAVSDMAGSSLYSTWSNTPNVNSPNEVVLRPSAYVVPDRL